MASAVAARLLEQHAVVTYRSVSTDAQISVEDARAQLVQLAAARPDVTVVRAEVSRSGVTVRLGGPAAGLLYAVVGAPTPGGELAQQWAPRALQLERARWQTQMQQAWAEGNWLRDNGGARVRCAAALRDMVEAVNYGGAAAAAGEKKKIQNVKPGAKMETVGVSDRARNARQSHAKKPLSKKKTSKHSTEAIFGQTASPAQKKKAPVKKKIELCEDEYDDEEQPGQDPFDRFEQDDDEDLEDVPLAQEKNLMDHPDDEDDTTLHHIPVVQDSRPDKTKIIDEPSPKESKVRPAPPSIFGAVDGPSRKRVAKERTLMNGKYLVTEKYYVYVDQDGNELPEDDMHPPPKAVVERAPPVPREPTIPETKPAELPTGHNANKKNPTDPSPVTPGPGDASRPAPQVTHALRAKKNSKKASTGQTALSSFFGKK